MDAKTFFKEEAKKANLVDSVIYIYDTVIVDIMEKYAQLKLKEYKQRNDIIYNEES